VSRRGLGEREGGGEGAIGARVGTLEVVDQLRLQDRQLKATYKSGER
jgi:hypothetical protein